MARPCAQPHPEQTFFLLRHGRDPHHRCRCRRSRSIATRAADQGRTPLREEILARAEKARRSPRIPNRRPGPNRFQPGTASALDQKEGRSTPDGNPCRLLAHTGRRSPTWWTTWKATGQFGNTLFFYVVGDNGSAEGWPSGQYQYMGPSRACRNPRRSWQARYHRQRRVPTPAHLAGWAWAMTTTQWVKQVASHLGGTRNPLVVTWPRGSRTGGLREQFSPRQ